MGALVVSMPDQAQAPVPRNKQLSAGRVASGRLVELRSPSSTVFPTKILEKLLVSVVDLRKEMF